MFLSESFFSFYADALALAVEEAQHWQQQALIDGLTGAFNRRSLHSFVDALQASDQSFVLFLVDLDSFKAINDTHGHAVGDKVLKAIAGNLRASTDTVFRIGGDEFVAVVQCDLQDVDAVCDRIQKSMKSVSVGGEIRCSASVGSAHSSIAMGAQELIQFADKQMYLEKARGRIERHRHTAIPPHL